ncbi:hypothetical protein [Lysinibacillus sp. BPa_S21]|uniref:hypothetical protein n=1 Tax=Lysinibacillus sp. BPa_S21 TaxID=2932478 RepID=UPI0020131337|nr:hypothetical protein [Lysinibacillus sp. BPa_S21]MCL1697333.1 hypothetical protein [Lysinibacillus sp. BPa_S21]
MNDHGINIEELLSVNEDDNVTISDTAEIEVSMFPAKEEGFNQVFLKEHTNGTQFVFPSRTASVNKADEKEN